jgi:hypothetical protein
MKVEQLQMVSREDAAVLYRKYQEHRVHQQPYDAEIARIYKHISRGRTVIRALESIRAAGCDEAGLPRLAIAPAHMQECFYSRNSRGEVTFGKQWPRDRDQRNVVRMQWPEAPETKRWWHSAQVPLIPIHLRPKRGLANYHILWEAEWSKKYPIDPYLLRRFGGDCWLVLAACDLTEVERAVMSGRATGN